MVTVVLTKFFIKNNLQIVKKALIKTTHFGINPCVKIVQKMVEIEHFSSIFTPQFNHFLVEFQQFANIKPLKRWYIAAKRNNHFLKRGSLERNPSR